jgi:hypothetical protein
MKKIIATIAIVLAFGFLGAEVASAHGHGHGHRGVYRPMPWSYCNPVNSRMGHRMMRYGIMGRSMPGAGHRPWTCRTTRGRAH